MAGQVDETSVLDCSLRDGGYYTAWDFDERAVSTYLASMAALDVGTVELGYCSVPKTGYFGAYHFLNPTTTAWAKSFLREDQQLGVMLDEKSVDPKDVENLLAPHVGQVDLVRIAVAPSRVSHAVDLARAIDELGLDVGINVMYLSQYWEGVLELPGIVEASQVASTISLVDSYGACTPEQVARAVGHAVAGLPAAKIGFHGHDNMGLAFANSLRARDAGARVVDGTVAGMGRGPGNTRTELLLVERARSTAGSLDYLALDRVMGIFDELRNEYRWGTNLPYMISGAAGLPQNDVMDWIGKNRYSVPSIIQALHGSNAETLDTVSYPGLTATASHDEAVVIGGGKSVSDQRRAIKEFIATSNVVVIHANHRHLELIDELDAESQYVCLAGDAPGQIPRDVDLSGADAVIVPVGPRFSAAVPEQATALVEVTPFFPSAADGHLGPVSDTGPLSLALGAVLALGVKRVTLVGFDGYEHATSAQQDLASEIQAIVDSFMALHSEIELASGTRTRYSVPVYSIHARLHGLPPATS